MASIITMGVLLYSASFFVIALYSLREYLNEIDESKKKSKISISSMRSLHGQ
jgi:hypothetical protein